MDQNVLTAGVDEAGRGPLAGPVVAAAVILDPRYKIAGLADSKQLTELKREVLYEKIITHSIAYAIQQANVAEIDQMNIFRANLLAMQRAVEALSTRPELVLVDGTHCPALQCKAQAIVKGDTKVAAISAASILAKVTRDRIMVEYDKKYPGYGFAKHKGYGTKQHMQALLEFGATPIHRQSFAPVRAVLEQQNPV